MFGGRGFHPALFQANLRIMGFEPGNMGGVSYSNLSTGGVPWRLIGSRWLLAGTC